MVLILENYSGFFGWKRKNLYNTWIHVNLLVLLFTLFIPTILFFTQFFLHQFNCVVHSFYFKHLCAKVRDQHYLFVKFMSIQVINIFFFFCYWFSNFFFILCHLTNTAVWLSNQSKIKNSILEMFTPIYLWITIYQIQLVHDNIKIHYS